LDNPDLVRGGEDVTHDENVEVQGNPNRQPTKEEDAHILDSADLVWRRGRHAGWVKETLASKVHVEEKKNYAG